MAEEQAPGTPGTAAWDLTLWPRGSISGGLRRRQHPGWPPHLSPPLPPWHKWVGRRRVSELRVKQGRGQEGQRPVSLPPGLLSLVLTANTGGERLATANDSGCPSCLPLRWPSMPVTGVAQWPLPGNVRTLSPSHSMGHRSPANVSWRLGRGKAQNPQHDPQIGAEGDAVSVSDGCCLRCWPRGHRHYFTPTADDTCDLQVTGAGRLLTCHARQGF